MMWEMDIGGPDWTGWKFSPWGRARSWRITDPEGNSYTAAEIASIRGMALDLDYLREQVRTLQQHTSGSRIYLTPDDAAILRTAAGILNRIGSAYRGERRSSRTGPNLLDLAVRHTPRKQPTKKAGGF